MSPTPPLAYDGAPPAWYGKIPGAGDFVNRRLPHALAGWWERWFQQGMAAMRQRGADEIERYYTVAPVWNFLIPAGTGTQCVQPGCLAPSCDRVGRYYPLLVTLPLGEADYWSGLPDVADAFYWQVGSALLDAIRHARAPGDLEASLENVRLVPGDVLPRAYGGVAGGVLATPRSKWQSQLESEVESESQPEPEPEPPATPAWPGLSGYFDPHGATSFWWTNRADGSPLRTHAHTGVPDSLLFLRLFGGSF
ncbi:type VI secretion system-associated protein TagF [Burkholderia sp. Ac-20353]|uniref:type VI secretion system-associated protein TagF n=1 Tax=Burkholderia sp. Ac-20353 TaxID=2703894 RepID=UPI00197B525F|nr:type VI secretion system-associated protein TagF [Burkholderia sp. Ac-20353]MBN3793024.1 type VI secretion system-associated protein TagF [Burkholderia sp. Ac-20353]